MPCIRARRLAAFVGALFLLTQAASANHAMASVTVSPATVNAYADVSVFFSSGGDRPTTWELQFPTGWLVAQQTGTSPITPIPDDEEQVGSGTLTGLWLHTLCTQGNVSVTITWEATIDGGAPANTVAQLTMTAAGLFNTQVYVVRNAANDYDFEAPNMPDELLCSSTTDGSQTLSFDGETLDGDKFLQNPSTAGTCRFTVVYGESVDVDVTIS